MTVALAFLPTTAQADEAGVAFLAGAGMNNFTDEDTNDALATLGSQWDARMVLGTDEHVAVEAAYVGLRQDIDVGGLFDDAGTVSGHGLEGALRLNATDQGLLRPYAFAGFGWRRFTADIGPAEFSDDVAIVPLGGGLSFDIEPILIDLRATYRPAFSDNLGENDEIKPTKRDLGGRPAALLSEFTEYRTVLDLGAIQENVPGRHSAVPSSRRGFRRSVRRRLASG